MKNKPAKLKNGANPMTPSKAAKELGCKSLVQVSEITGIPVSTLKDWHRQKPETFHKICKLVANHGNS